MKSQMPTAVKAPLDAKQVLALAGCRVTPALLAGDGAGRNKEQPFLVNLSVEP